jgi:dTMP kinase
VKPKSLFVTFEGIEGSGKTSQIVSLARTLRGYDRNVVVTREPGGTKAGDEIRRLFLGPKGAGLDPWAELFLVEAARVQHLAEVVRPALAAGKIVLCDRSTDSTIAYQGYGRGLPLDVIRYLHRLGALCPAPDLTLLFDLTVTEGLKRAGSRNSAIDPRLRSRESRIDDESIAFHERVRRGYLALAGSQPLRIIKIPAAAEPEVVRARVKEVVLGRLGLVASPVRATAALVRGTKAAR